MLGGAWEVEALGSGPSEMPRRQRAASDREP